MRWIILIALFALDVGIVWLIVRKVKSILAKRKGRRSYCQDLRRYLISNEKTTLKRVVIVGMLPTVIRAIATKRNHVLKALSKKTHRLKNFRSSEV